MPKQKFLLISGLALLLSACGNANTSGDDADAGPVSPADMVYQCPADKVLALSDYPADPANDIADFTDWLAENAKREEVNVTASGLQYRVAQEGLKAGASPEGGQVVTVHYHGYFPDGSVFDSSYQRGQTIDFPANGVIQGWVESLQGMKTCEARTLYIPGDLAYGPSGRGSIPPNATLLFNVQLIAVQPQ